MRTCDDIRILLGAYALGSLDRAEEWRVREHLESCDACSQEAAELADVAAALALVDAADIEPAEPPDMLPGLLARVRAYRLRRRVVAIAAAVSLAVLAGIGGLVAGDRDAAPAAEPPVASVSGEEAGVTLAVDAWDKGWGTALRADVSGVPGGSRCSLVAVGSDGTEEVAASWVVPGNGYEDTGGLTVDGAVGLRSADVDHYAVVTVDGSTLVVAPTTNSR
jgi:hypothetical protein